MPWEESTGEHVTPTGWAPSASLARSHSDVENYLSVHSPLETPAQVPRRVLNLEECGPEIQRGPPEAAAQDAEAGSLCQRFVSLS